jgi:hypothetical protein
VSGRLAGSAAVTMCWPEDAVQDCEQLEQDGFCMLGGLPSFQPDVLTITVLMAACSKLWSDHCHLLNKHILIAALR